MAVAPIYLAFFLLFSSTSVFAGDLFDMLQRMSDADQEHSYQGIFILRKSDSLSTLKVTHGKDEDGVWESLEALNGEPRKVVRRNNKVVSVFPGRELVTIRHNADKQALHPQLPEDIGQLELFYSISQLPDDRIANYPTLVVDLIPNDDLRYGYRYWIEKSNGLLLRCDLVDENNSVVEQMMFTSFEYLPQAPASAFDLKKYEHYRQQLLDGPAADVSREAPLQWAINTLPKGFMLTQSTMRYTQSSLAENNLSAGQIGMTSAKPDLLHLVYSDGLASVSVFIEKKRDNKKYLQGAVTMGAVNAFGHYVEDYYVTVVGEVPEKTVRAMARSAVKIK